MEWIVRIQTISENLDQSMCSEFTIILLSNADKRLFWPKSNKKKDFFGHFSEQTLFETNFFNTQIFSDTIFFGPKIFWVRSNLNAIEINLVFINFAFLGQIVRMK